MSQFAVALYRDLLRIMGPLTHSKQRHSQWLEDRDLLRGLQSPEQAERVASAQGGRHPIVSNGHSQQFSMHIATACRLEGESLLPFIA